MKKMVVLLALAMFVVISARADVTWNGSESSDWGNPNNWVEGRIPDDEDVYITGDGFAPTNQNIVNLTIRAIKDNGFDGRIDVYGEPFTLTDYDQINNSNQTFAIWADVTFSQASSCTIRSGCRFELYGNIYETSGVSYRPAVSGSGTYDIYGTNYCTGGVNAQQGTIILRKGAYGFGEAPETYVSDSLRSNFGSIYLYNPIDGCYDINISANRGIALLNGSIVLCDKDMRMFIHSDITVSTGADGIARFGTLAIGGLNGGAFWLNKSGMITGAISLDSWIYCNTTNVFTSTTDSTRTSSIGSGTLDLNGNDFLDRDISYSNNSGVYGVGGIINSNTNQPSTIDGDFTQMSTGSQIFNFGGSGEIILEGNTGVANGGASLCKGGNGILRLKGTTTGNRYVSIRCGKLILDYRDNTAAKIPTDQILYLEYSDLEIEPNDTSDINVDVSTLSPRDSFSNVKISSSAGAKADLNIVQLDFRPQAAINFSVVDGGAGTPVISTSEPDGSLNPYVTFNNRDFGQVLSGEIVAETDYTDVSDNTEFEAVTTIDNINITGTFTAGTPGARVRSLRFDSSETLTLTSNLDLGLIDNGGFSGILITEDAGDVTIDGGSLNSGVNCNTHVFNYDADSTLTLGSQLAGAQSSGDNWYFSGPGKIVITNESNNIAALQINGGVTLEFPSFNCLGVGSSLTIANANLCYVGSGEATAYTMNIRSHSTIESSGSGLLEFTSTGNVVTTDVGNYNDLTLTGSGDGSFAGNLNLVMGRVIKKGLGTWTLTAAQTYVGKTEILAGELAVVESVERDVYVGPNGTLSGSPDIGRDFTTEGTLLIDLTAGKTMTVGCTATLGGTLVLEGELLEGEEFVLLEATTVVGSFENTPEKYIVTVDGENVVVSKAPPQGSLIIIN